MELLVAGLALLSGLLALGLALALRGRLRRLENLAVALVYSNQVPGREGAGGGAALRAPVSIPVTVRLGKKAVEGRLHDLSKTGCRVVVAEPLAPGVQLAIDVKETYPVALKAMVKRVLGEGEVGVAFVDLDRTAQIWINKRFTDAFRKLMEEMS